MFEKCNQVLVPGGTSPFGRGTRVEEFCHTDWMAVAILVAAIAVVAAALIVAVALGRQRRSE